MITKENLERVKSLFRSEDELDHVIGMGLAIEKGMSVEELAKWAINLKVNDMPEGAMKSFFLMNEKYVKDTVIKEIKTKLNIE